MKKRVRKAQFTIFVILGLVMLIMAIFIIYAMTSITRLNTEKQARETITSALDSATVNYYVQSCLKLATEQAIDEIALQGGVLYNHQERLSTREPTEPGKTHIVADINFGEENIIRTNVSYGIQRENNCGIINYDIPFYPRPNVELSELWGFYEQTWSCSVNRENHLDHSGFFGLNNLTRLCIQGSKNSQKIKNVGPSPCHFNWRNVTNIRTNQEEEYEPLAIEELLQKRILSLLESCIDFNVLEELQGSNIEVDNQKPPDLEVILNRRSLSVTVSYPFIAQLRTGGARSIRHEFSYSSPLRITQLHNYVMSLLAADTKDITFNLSSLHHQREYTKSNLEITFSKVKHYYHPDFEVKIINIDCELQNQNCNEYQHDRLLIVKDKASIIDGRPLTFVTAIQNRKPALDFINEFDQRSYNYNLFVRVGDELIIEPQGYDPDDRELTYSYSGWKSQELMQSEIFQTTNKDANYTTVVDDTGLQIVTVHVCDVAGLCDYQDVKILIFDPPTLTIDTISIYDDSFNGMTSIEDLITLVGGIEDTSGETIDSIIYNWKIFKGSEQIWSGNTGDDTQLKIPQDINNQITDELIKIIKPLLLNQTGMHKIILNAEVTYQNIGPIFAEPFDLELEVKKCLPERSPIYSYPYNTVDNPFLANHTCCDDNFNILGDTTPCYTATFFGEFNKLKQKAEEQLKINMLPPSQITNPSFQPNTPPPNTINDIFKMTLTRNCDGNRGNICAGPLTAQIQQTNSCIYDQNLLEQCKGPTNTVNENQNQLSCVTYTTTSLNNKQSFELIYGLQNKNGQPATGKCNLEPGACSTIGSQGYNVAGGKYWCTAAYCDNGNCKRTFNDDTCNCNATCGAQCYAGKTYDWTGFTCSYGNCQNCEFQGSAPTKCTAPNSGDQTHCYNSDGFCYSQVQCTNSGARHTPGEYCKRGELFKAEITSDELTNPTEVNGCVYGPYQNNQCAINGKCNYNTIFFTCQTGNALCNNQGASCESLGVITSPQTYNNVYVRSYS
jgi:hypothetical protein